MSKAVKSTPGRRRLFEEDDRVKINLPGEKSRNASIAQYDTAARKLLVKYENEKQVDKTWISTKHAQRIDAKGKVIPRPTPSRTESRSNSRGRSTSPNKKVKAISSRTRSKSRERVTADFSADDSQSAAEPTKVSAKKSPKKRKTISTPKRTAKSALKDAEFSADDEEQDLTAAAEKNSREMPSVSNCFSFCSNFVCGTVTKIIKLAYFYVTFVLNAMHVSFTLFLKNVPMILSFAATLYVFLTIVDKKNIRYQSLWPLKFPATPANKIGNFKWMNVCSWNFNGWKTNFNALWSVLQFPVCMSAAFHLITYLKGCFPSYKITIGSKPRVTSQVNLMKVWMSMTALTAVVLYMDKIYPQMTKLCPIDNPITPILGKYFLLAHSYVYDGICMVFRSTSKFYFNILLLALFKSYDDFDFDFDLDWKTWFMNPIDTTSMNTRFLCTFGSEMFLQTSFFVLAARNPNNIYLWIIFNSRFVQNYLSYRAGDQEELSLRRHYTSTSLSGWFFYSNQVFKAFAFTNIWRFISKIDRVTSCKFGIAAFAGLQLASFLFSYMANKDFPSEKRNGIHGKIRHADRLADICGLAAMTALCEFNFGNVPYVVLGLFVIMQVVDVCWQEEAQRVKSKTKWETYFNRVPFKFIPKVY